MLAPLCRRAAFFSAQLKPNLEKTTTNYRKTSENTLASPAYWIYIYGFVFCPVPGHVSAEKKRLRGGWVGLVWMGPESFSAWVGGAIGALCMPQPLRHWTIAHSQKTTTKSVVTADHRCWQRLLHAIQVNS